MSGIEGGGAVAPVAGEEAVERDAAAVVQVREGRADVADLGRGGQCGGEDGDVRPPQYVVDEFGRADVQLAVGLGGGPEGVFDGGAAAVLRLHLDAAQTVLRVQARTDLPAPAAALDVGVPGAEPLGVEVGAEVARRAAAGQVEDVVAVGEPVHEEARAVEGEQVLAVGTVLECRGRVDLGERGTAQRGQAETGREDGGGGHETVTCSRGSASWAGAASPPSPGTAG